MGKAWHSFMDVRIIDTTLRDGEQKPGLAFSLEEKVEIARLLDVAGIYQIEAGTPAMGGTEKKSVAQIVGLKLRSRISAWNRLVIEDLDHSIDCGVDVIHISVPSSDLQIKVKINKDRRWVLEEMKKCIAYAREKGFSVSVGLEDASRADPEFLSQLCQEAAAGGVNMVRYADTVGILYPARIYQEIKRLREMVKIDLGVHVHNDFGMAVANSLSAVRAGARYVDCTVGGIGERAGNCNYRQFMRALQGLLPADADLKWAAAQSVETDILKIISNNSLSG